MKLYNYRNYNIMKLYYNYRGNYATRMLENTDISHSAISRFQLS